MFISLGLAENSKDVRALADQAAGRFHGENDGKMMGNYPLVMSK
jgi:hypothetical protein